MLKLVGPGHAIDQKIGGFSTGILKRFGPAQAPINEPSILFPEGATSSIDPLGAQEMRDLVSNLSREQGVTVFLSLHSMTEVDEICDRFAIAGCALDERARGVVAISTCGYGIDALVASARMKDPVVIRFYRSVDPDTYLDEISPRTFVMIHSSNDPVIPYDSTQQTYIKIGEPKSLHIIEAEGHGYNAFMNPFLEAELARIFS